MIWKLYCMNGDGDGGDGGNERRMMSRDDTMKRDTTNEGSDVNND